MIIAGEWCKDSDEWTFCACVCVSSRASAVIAHWQWTAAAVVDGIESERESEFRLGPRSRGGGRDLSPLRPQRPRRMGLLRLGMSS